MLRVFVLTRSRLRIKVSRAITVRALILRIGFGVYCIINILRNPKPRWSLLNSVAYQTQESSREM